jgi:hypothetical protein
MNRNRLILMLSGLTLLALCSGALWRLSTTQKLGKPGLKALPIAGDVRMEIPLPVNVLNFTSRFVPPDFVTSNTLPQETSLSQRVYTAPDGFQLTMNVVMMATDRTSIHKPQFCLLGQGWRIEKTERESVLIPKPHPYQMPFMALTASREIELEGRKQPVRGVYVYWFVADNALTADHWERMWWMSRELLTTGTLQRWAYVSLFAVCYPGQESAVLARIKQFIPDAVPQFQTATGPPTRAGGGFTQAQ